MRAELAEDDAEGEIAAIYGEIRRLCGVPYVSSLQRHLATRPGWLEWAWAAIGPVFSSGLAQETAWRLADDVALDPLSSISVEALRTWGVSMEDEAIVKAVCESFVRVSPTNMVFSALLKALLSGAKPGGAAVARPWTPPAELPPLPSLVPLSELPAPVAGLLRTLRSGDEAAPFVPGLYRMLAHWPGLLAHLATELSPRLGDREMQSVGDMLGRRIDGVVPELLRYVSATAGAPTMPPAVEHEDVLAALTVYRRTSPEMIVCGRLIRDALPR